MTSLLDRFAGQTVAVLGDLMMDEYVWGQASRVSPESPVLVIDVQRETAVPGGAANVAANVVALGGRASVFGVVGEDRAGEALRTALGERGVGVEGVVTEPARVTTRKTRVVAQSQQVLRVDREERRDLDALTAERLLAALTEALPGVDAVLASDYAKGVVSAEVARKAIAACREAGVPFLVNAKPRSVPWLMGATVMTVNVSEAVAASGDDRFADDGSIHAAGAEMREATGVETLVVTRGAKGLIAWTAAGESVAVPAHPVEVYDVAGAGDTVAATLALALASGASVAEAAQLAVRAAAVVVGKVGVATVSAEELRAALRS